ncbi:MAG: pilus assembly protein TadG-related protein [Motiliproteus sp.]
MKFTSMSVTNRPQPLHRQQGSIVAIVAISMVALLALAGLALDGGHMLLSKTRLQNVVDASALSAAKALAMGENVITAESEAVATFALNAAATGNQELGDAYSAGDIAVVVEFSDSIDPFTPDGSLTDPAFVRVRVDSFDLQVWLSQVVGFTDKSVAASAVAGESPVLDEEVCDIAPVMACGDEDAENYGYDNGQLTVLKIAANDGTTVGPGNFQILAIDGVGGSVFRKAAAGGETFCITADADPSSEDTTEILLEPGNKVGPTVQGFNNRFDMHGGGNLSPPELYPPDRVVHYETPGISLDANDNIVEPDTLFRYSDYDIESKACGGAGTPQYSCVPNGEPYKRVLVIPIGDCNGTTNGRDFVDIWGFGCFFLVQPVEQQGNQAQLYGEFVDVCNADGSFGPVPTTETGPTKLILYKDSSSGDS